MTGAAIVVNGARLYYELHGPEDAAAVVVLHGGPGLADCRDQVRDFGALASDFRLLFYDARGCGRSEPRPPYTHAQWVEDLDELTRTLGIDTFALVAHSYGGFVALEYAIAHPERLRRMVLVDTAASSLDMERPIRRALEAGLPGLDEDSVRRLFEGRVASDDEFRRLWERLLPIYFEGPFDPELPRRLADSAYFHHATHNHAFRVNNPSYDVRPLLPEVAVRTLAICGGDDWIAPLARSMEIVHLLPESRLEVFDHSGHLPMLDEPERFHAVLRWFLDEDPEAAGCGAGAGAALAVRP